MSLNIYKNNNLENVTGYVDIDDELDSESTNPISNKAVSSNFSTIDQNIDEIDNQLSDNNKNFIFGYNNGVYGYYTDSTKSDFHPFSFKKLPKSIVMVRNYNNDSNNINTSNLYYGNKTTFYIPYIPLEIELDNSNVTAKTFNITYDGTTTKLVDLAVSDCVAWSVFIINPTMFVLYYQRFIDATSLHAAPILRVIKYNTSTQKLVIGTALTIGTADSATLTEGLPVINKSLYSDMQYLINYSYANKSTTYSTYGRAGIKINPITANSSAFGAMSPGLGTYMAEASNAKCYSYPGIGGYLSCKIPTSTTVNSYFYGWVFDSVGLTSASSTYNTSTSAGTKLNAMHDIIGMSTDCRYLYRATRNSSSSMKLEVIEYAVFANNVDEEKVAATFNISCNYILGVVNNNIITTSGIYYLELSPSITMNKIGNVNIVNSYPNNIFSSKSNFSHIMPEYTDFSRFIAFDINIY